MTPLLNFKMTLNPDPQDNINTCKVLEYLRVCVICIIAGLLVLMAIMKMKGNVCFQQFFDIISLWKIGVIFQCFNQKILLKTSNQVLIYLTIPYKYCNKN